MIQIKKEEAFEKYLSNDQRQIKALGLATASLRRCLKLDLLKNKNKQSALAAAATGTISTTLNSNNNNNSVTVQ